MMAAIEWFMRELHGRIDSLKARIGSRLCEVQVLVLSSLRKVVSTLRFEVWSLIENYILVVPLMVPSFTYPLLKLPPMVFYLYADNDEAQIVGFK